MSERMTPSRRLAAIALLCVLAVALGCRANENPEELQTLAGDVPQTEVSSPSSSADATSGFGIAGDESLGSFPLVGSAFPGLGGRLHSSLCDPASDPFSTCI
jgi:hypothetical protein